jgi:hypothetical protein
MLTGLAALRGYGVRAARAFSSIHVVVPHGRRRQARPGLILERWRELPVARERAGLVLAPPGKCTIDACRELERLDDVRELVADVVQSRICGVGELDEALAKAARQRSALPREVLAEVSAGVRSAAEARTREVFARRGIPQPRWNWSLLAADDHRHLVTPDGWWEDIGCALQVDSMAWHLSPGLYRRTQQLQRVLARYDVPFLTVAPADVFEAEDEFVEEVRAFLRRHADHVPSPDVIAVPPR